MKGMLSKAFSLALLISVVPSFAMNAKAVAEKAAEEVPAEVALVVNAGQQMADASSATTTVRNNVVSAGITIAAPTVWDRVKHYADLAKYYANNMYTSAANSSAAGYAHAALVAPFNYTVGALATKSGLADRVPGFVKNDSYYSSTMAKYAFGLAAMYAGYKSVKAVYNYMTTPAEKKAEAVKSVVAQTSAPVAKSVPRTCKAEKEALSEALTALYKKALAGQTLADSKELNALRAFDFLAVNTTHNGKRRSLTDGVMNKNVKTYFALISELASDIDFTRTHSAKIANAKVEELNTLCSTIELHFNTQPAAIHEKLNFKEKEAAKREASLEALNAQAQYTPGFATRAYNALVNRYTLGAATVAGLGYAGYKYGVPYYNKTK